MNLKKSTQLRVRFSAGVISALVILLGIGIKNSFAAKASPPPSPGGLAQSPFRLLTDRPVERMAAAQAQFFRLTGRDLELYQAPDVEAFLRTTAVDGKDFVPDLIAVKDLAIAHRLIAQGKARRFSADTIQQALDRGVFPPMVDQESGFFIGLSARIRTLAYSASLKKDLVDSVSRYADLGDEKWLGRVCLRTSSHDYNRVLIAGLLTRFNDPSQVMSLVSGWVKNLAQAVNRNDRSILQDIANGVCDLGVVNHYYWANEKDVNPGLPVEIKVLDRGAGGALMNGSFVLVANQSTASQNAVDLAVQSLLSEDSQSQISSLHNEFSSVSSIKPKSLFLQSIWPLEVNPEPLSRVRAQLNDAASLTAQVAYP